ncbi:sigma-70 family RNA polymerase sigma factor [Floccifex sp.]|uniref:sigma-70 family RNA polymerase sigma factor n=1 Tax=Floccifex sp. TaxID=2815810 RepID=UPI003F0BA7DD
MEKVNINKWIYYYFIQDEEALSFLIEYFTPMMISISHKKLDTRYFENNTMEDYLSICYCVLVECIHRYRIDKKVTFSTYLNNVLTNRIVDMSRSTNHLYNGCYPQFLPLNAKINEDSQRYTFEEIIQDQRKCSLHSYVTGKIALEDIMEKAKNELPEIEQKILVYRYLEYSNTDISEILSISRQSIQYRMKKIQKWLNKIDKNKNKMIN